MHIWQQIIKLKQQLAAIRALSNKNYIMDKEKIN